MRFTVDNKMFILDGRARNDSQTNKRFNMMCEGGGGGGRN